jgi:hypothetical protein
MYKKEDPMRRSFLVLVLGFGYPLAAVAQVPAEATPAAEEPVPPASPATPPTPTPEPPAPTPAAATTTAPAPAPPAPATPPPVAFGWEALVDAYYLYNFTGDPKSQAPLFRQFDTTANNFALNYAKLGVHAETQLVSFRMDIGAGHAAAIINNSGTLFSAPGSSATPSDTTSLYGHGLLVQQAFATVRPASFLAIDAGKFVTSASAEVIEANKNWLYSRSLLFFGVPLLHTGLRVNIAPTPSLAIMLEICNGWNNDPDINNAKTLGGNVTWAPPNAGLTAGITTYVGKEGGPDGDNTRLLLDGVFLKDLGNLAVGANLDYFKLGDAYWFGGSAMGRLILSDMFNVAARAEYLKSKNNGYYTGPDAALYEVTAQVAWTMDKHYELRLEGRADMSDQEIFAKGTTPRTNQITGLLAALAYF